MSDVPSPRSDVDARYLAARRVLLDALGALSPYGRRRSSLVELEAALRRGAPALGQVLAAALAQRPERGDVDEDGAAVLALAALAPRDRQAQVADLQLPPRCGPSGPG